MDKQLFVYQLLYIQHKTTKIINVVTLNLYLYSTEFMTVCRNLCLRQKNRTKVPYPLIR